MEVSMRHLKDINMKKATLLLVMTCCTIGLGRVGADEDGGEVSRPEVSRPEVGTTDPTSEKPAEQQTVSKRDFHETFEKFKTLITGFKYVSAKIDDPYWNPRTPLTDCIRGVNITQESLTDLAATLKTLQEKVTKDLIRTMALGLVNSSANLSALTKKNGSNNENSSIVMLIESPNPKQPGYQVLTSEQLKEHIEDYSKAFREISGLDIETLVVSKGRFQKLQPLTPKEEIELIAHKMCQILLSCLALKSATLNGLEAASGEELDKLNPEFSSKIEAFNQVIKDMKDPNKIGAKLLQSVLKAFEDLIQTAFKCASANNRFLVKDTIDKIQSALGVPKKSWSQLPTFSSFVQQSGSVPPSRESADTFQTLRKAVSASF